MAGCCECGDEPLGSCATELVSDSFWIKRHLLCEENVECFWGMLLDCGHFERCGKRCVYSCDFYGKSVAGFQTGGSEVRGTLCCAVLVFDES
jgi:hypothetical protein